MAKDRNQSDDFVGPLRRLLVGLVVMVCLAVFMIWRIDSPRVERLRMAVIDAVLPQMDWAMAPVTAVVNLVSDFQSYQQLYDQNRDLRRELQQMRAWREAALQLEQENAKLRDLNNVRVDPNLTWITGVVMTDAGSPFKQSVLLNVGERDGVLDGWPAMDGMGLVGRIAGVGQQTARVILVTDASSRLSVLIQPSGQRAILAGDNSYYPALEFLENPDVVRPGDRVITSGDGAVFPPDLLVGQVALGTDGRLRVRLSADFERLEFLRVLRSPGTERIEDPGALILPAAADDPRAEIDVPSVAEALPADAAGDPANAQPGEQDG